MAAIGCHWLQAYFSGIHDTRLLLVGTTPMPRLRITVNLPDSYRPLLDARIKELRRTGDSHYGRCLIDDDLGIGTIKHLISIP